MIAVRRAGLMATDALARAIGARDPFTGGHDGRVSALARRIGQEMGLPENQIEIVEMVGTLHDIGKLGVASDILLKPSQLNEHEMALMQQHPAHGARIVEAIQTPWPLAAAVRQHHERLDGSGYPYGLKGDEILLEAQIVAIADVVDAMCSHRPYRAARGINAACDELVASRGIRFNAAAVDACLAVLAATVFTQLSTNLRVAN